MNQAKPASLATVFFGTSLLALVGIALDSNHISTGAILWGHPIPTDLLDGDGRLHIAA